MLIIARHYLVLSSYFVTVVGRQKGRKTSRWVVFTYHDFQLLRFLTKDFILDGVGILGLPMPKGEKSKTDHIWLVVILKGNIKSKWRICVMPMRVLLAINMDLKVSDLKESFLSKACLRNVDLFGIVFKPIL